MKAEELRIGNWIKLQGLEKPSRVWIIDTTETTTETKAKPISLTDEWLEMFCFQKKHKVYDYFELNEWITLTKTNANEQEQGYDVRFKNTYICRVNKVHVLQNICYYLNNFEELTIKSK